MIKKLLFILAFSVYHISYSQTDTTIKLIPQWKVNDIRRYEIKKYSSLDAGEEKIKNCTTKEIVLQVTDINDIATEISWKIVKLSFSDTINKDNPFISLINTFDKDVSVRYSINKNGNIEKIINLEEVTAIIKAKVDTALEEFFRKNKTGKSEADMLRFQFYMMYCTQEQVKDIVLNDIYRFHQIYGYSFTNKKITIIPDEIFAPNPDGKPSNNLEIKLDNFDPNSKIISLTGELHSTETDQKLKEMLENNRDIRYAHTFSGPENWLISYKETFNSDGYGVGLLNTFEIQLINKKE